MELVTELVMGLVLGTNALAPMSKVERKTLEYNLQSSYVFIQRHEFTAREGVKTKEEHYNFIFATDANALIIARKDKRERGRNTAEVQTMRQDETI